MTGPACGNNPHHKLTDGDRQAVDSFRAYLTDRATLNRVRAVLETEHVVGRTALEYRGLITAALMGDAPPAGQTALRDRIADALDNANHTHPCPVTGSTYWTGCYHPDGVSSISCHTSRRTDAVLAVLPTANHDTDTSAGPVGRAEYDTLVDEADRLRRDGAALHARAEGIDKQLAVLQKQVAAPVDRAAVLREAADDLIPVEVPPNYTGAWALAYSNAVQHTAERLRRMADETAATETQADSATLLELVRDFLDPDPCAFDHHGYCQAHGYLGGEPMSCPHGRAKKLLAELEQPAAGARQDKAQP